MSIFVKIKVKDVDVAEEFDYFWEIGKCIKQGIINFEDYEQVIDPLMGEKTTYGVSFNNDEVVFDDIATYGNLNSFFYKQGNRITLTNGSYIECTSFTETNRNYTIDGESVPIPRKIANLRFYLSDGTEMPGFTGGTEALSTLFSGLPAQNITTDWRDNKLSYAGSFVSIHPEYEDDITNIAELVEFIQNNGYDNINLTFNRKPPLIINQYVAKWNTPEDIANGTLIPYKIVPFVSADGSISINEWYSLGNDATIFNFYDTTNQDDPSQNQATFWIKFFEGAEDAESPDIPDPNIPSGPGGGGGSWDSSSEDAGGIDLPSLQGLDLGIISAYQVSSAQLRELASLLWSTDVMDAIAKMFTQPLNAIISLHTIPVDVSGASTTIMLGGYASGVGANKLSTRYYAVDLGTITLAEYEGSYVDYTPHTNVSIYLPFIGIVKMNTNEVMGANINVQYAIDVLTGECIANVRVAKGNLNSVLYTYHGNCISYLPLTSFDNSNFSVGALTSAAGALAGVAMGNVPMIVAGGVGAFGSNLGSMMGLGYTSHSGSLTGNAAFMNHKSPYLIIERQVQAYPNNYRKFLGRTSLITMTFGECQGYTEIENIDLNGIYATNEEKDDLMTLLKEGVYI